MIKTLNSDAKLREIVKMGRSSLVIVEAEKRIMELLTEWTAKPVAVKGPVKPTGEITIAIIVSSKIYALVKSQQSLE